MKAIRWAAAAATALMGLMNVGAVLDAGTPGHVAVPVAWAFVLVGLAGLAGAAGLVVRSSWGRPVVLAVGAVNLVGGIVALTQQVEGAVIGIVVAALGLGLGYLARGREVAPARA